MYSTDIAEVFAVMSSESSPAQVLIYILFYSFCEVHEQVIYWLDPFTAVHVLV